MPREFRPKRAGAQPITDTMTVVVLRQLPDTTEPVEETHEFTVQARSHFGDVLGILNATARRDATEQDQLQAVPYLLRVISRCMVDKDGTPLKWQPRIVDGHFTAPDGKHLPERELPAVLAFDAGSSRRRWDHLMFVDDEVEIEEDQVIDILHWLIEFSSSALGGAAPGRPTTRSSSS